MDGYISKPLRTELLSAEIRRKGGTMEEAKDVSQGASVDLPELLARVDNDRELLHDLLSIFKEEFPRHLYALQEAVASEDCKQAEAVSHTLKGMLANLAVTRAAACAAQLEQLARGEDKKSLKEALAAFEREVRGLLPEMETYMAEVQP
jgi:HPt (histidine-containing phosphotransfer) domain-containing protein